MSLESDLEIIPQDSLVLYKKRPARVTRVGESKAGLQRLEIEVEGGNLAKVRSKDVALLHPGPLKNLNQLQPKDGEVELAWEILRETPGKTYRLSELAEILFGQYTPISSWAAWQYVEDGLFFQGIPNAITAKTPQEVSRIQDLRKARKEETLARADFIDRARKYQFSFPEDNRFFKEIEEVALGRKKESRLLQDLGRSERPENAHAMLLESGYWTEAKNPYPVRFGLPTSTPVIHLPDLVEEPRLDLTDIAAYAIDDRQNRDPDDAISLVSCRLDEQGNFLYGRIWVHIADVAALVSPGSQADMEARSRGATLYLPETSIPMLPAAAVQSLGLGLNQISPALSFGLELNSKGHIEAIEIKASLVRVKRMSYEEVERQMDQEPFTNLNKIAEIYSARRKTNGALFIDLPEVNIRVLDGQVSIEPLLKLRSRDLVRETMLMVGEAAASYAIDKSIPIPFATQEAPNINEKGNPLSLEDLASQFSIRRYLKRSQISSIPKPHAGVGLQVYTRATSPLRRYLDLVVHQQLRAYIHDQPLINQQDILDRVGASEQTTGIVTQAEALARRHWTLVYLIQHPDWRGQGILVEREGLDGTVIIPELALETHIQLSGDFALNSTVPLRLSGINLAELDVRFTNY